ncbi:unnamed protein product [Adineta steineri]|uniref:B30.2/SPRY domain-containing protein n=1 Tax=Adineta steineri TaxID=433720 RepID=A0A814AZT1_9BILA|nr:unnamed protein product [Adineta steineri]CAF0920800.1 unnamed protein product [Adineta steineri]
MIVKHDCLRGESMIENGLCSLWSGIRATYGMNQGRIAYQIKIRRHIHCSELLNNEIPFGIRIGWSVDGNKFCLGKQSLSYGYEQSGKFWTKNQFEWYGEQYSIGDIITCYADFESEPGNVLLSFAKNDLNFNLAYRINYKDLYFRPLFPHIFIKNISFQVNFGQLNIKYPLRTGFHFINNYHEDERIRGILQPSSKEECEVIMMVGLPAAGKSLWIERHCAIYTDKKYVILSTNNIIKQMNTNVFGNARRRKMSLFDGYFRRAVVVVPNNNEYERRRHQQQIEQDKFTPDLFINEMKTKFDLPEVGDVFDDVEYAELAFREARDLVMYYRQQSQIVEEILRKNNKRKRKDNSWIHSKKNNQKSIQFNDNRNDHNIQLSFRHKNSSSQSYSKQHHYHSRRRHMNYN